MITTTQYTVIGNHMDMNDQPIGGMLMTETSVVVLDKDEPYQPIFGFFYDRETGEIIDPSEVTTTKNKLKDDQ
jgi:hypothetical protein